MSADKSMPIQAWLSMRPPREFEEMRQRFEDDIARPFIRSVWDRIPEEVKGWTPAVDVFEKGDTFVVKVELPGMKQEDFDVSVAEDVLTIKGERKPESGVKYEDYRRNEIANGSFFRRISVPSGLDAKSIEAVYEDGVLRITLQRTAGAKPKKVNVQVKKSAT